MRNNNCENTLLKKYERVQAANYTNEQLHQCLDSYTNTCADARLCNSIIVRITTYTTDVLHVHKQLHQQDMRKTTHVRAHHCANEFLYE